MFLKNTDFLSLGFWLVTQFNVHKTFIGCLKILIFPGQSCFVQIYTEHANDKNDNLNNFHSVI